MVFMYELYLFMFYYQVIFLSLYATKKNKIKEIQVEDKIYKNIQSYSTKDSQFYSNITSNVLFSLFIRLRVIWAHLV